MRPPWVCHTKQIIRWRVCLFLPTGLPIFAHRFADLRPPNLCGPSKSPEKTKLLGKTAATILYILYYLSATLFHLAPAHTLIPLFLYFLSKLLTLPVSLPYNKIAFDLHGLIRCLERLRLDLLSFKLNSIVGVLGLSLELNDASSDTSEFYLTKANNPTDNFSTKIPLRVVCHAQHNSLVFIHRQTDFSHLEPPLFRNGRSIHTSLTDLAQSGQMI